MFATKRWLALLLLSALVAGLGLLGGCCAVGLKACAPVDQLVISGGAKLNSCSGDDYSYPVAVRVYYLSDKAAFETAELQELWEDERQVLGGSLSAPAADLTVVPGGAPIAWKSPRPAGAAWLGIAANFCRLDGTAWRTTISLDKGVDARVTLQDVQLSLSSDR
jgi:type VI secretion system VasD/TssJ family lipoprotein